MLDWKDMGGMGCVCPADDVGRRANANLSQANSVQTNLSNANLIATILTGANLTSATLTNANLMGANLTNATLTNANLTGAKLTQANLTGAKLTQANLTEANLTIALLPGANLTGANLTRANLMGANLTGVNMKGMNLSGATLTDANLTGADLRGTDLSEGELSRANLAGMDLTGVNLNNANLMNATLTGTNLSKANLMFSNLTNANLMGAILNEAWLQGATWTNGKECQKGSNGRCVIQAPTPMPTPTNAFDSLTPELFIPGETVPTVKSLGGAVKSSVAAVRSLFTAATQALVLKTRYFVLYENERPLLAIETNALRVRVVEGVLHYGGTYQYYVLDVSTSDEVMNSVGPISFTTPAKPLDEDDFGNPLIAQGLKDAQGRSIPLADTKLSTLIAAGKDLLSQQGTLAAIRGAAGAMKDQNSKTLTTMNTNVVRVVRSKGGQGAAVIIAASDANLMETIHPLTDSGYSMDKGGNLKPDITIASSNISLPLGLFDFSVSIANNTNRTDVVIIPPAPFAADTKWYKVTTDGTLKEYPNFKVDALGNGILTLYDNDEWDKNPAFGIIRDPGGPGVVTATESGGKIGCFIATAAYGSYLHPFVNILRTFRDRVLLVSSLGSSFVEWYYRVSPPIANVISRHSVLSAAVRILLLPAIGIAWLSLQVGIVPAVLVLLFVCALLTLGIRIGRRRSSTPSI